MCQPPNANSPAATASEKFVNVTGGNATDGAGGGMSPLSAQPRTMIARTASTFTTVNAVCTRPPNLTPT